MSGLQDVTVVITSHQAGETLLATVADALAIGAASVLLVDSGSDDGSVEAAEAAHPELLVERLPTNPGPCATRNLGLRSATTPFVLLLDDDMRLEAGCVETLHSELSSDLELVLCGPSIWQTDAGGEARVQYAGGAWNYAGLAHIHESEAEVSRDVDILTSGCVLARRERLLEVRGFDEAFFFLMEDVDLCLRCRAMGWRLRVVAGARAWNRGGSEGLSIQGRSYPTRRARLHARNRPLLLVGLYELRTLFVLAPAILLLDLAWFAFAILSGRPGAWVQGRWQFLGQIPAVCRRRRWWKQLRREPDRVFLSAAPVTVTAAAAEKAAVRRFLGLLNGGLRLYWRLAKRLLR